VETGRLQIVEALCGVRANSLLLCHGRSRFAQLTRQRVLVNLFEKPKTERVKNPERTA
jgi:hypothetical protein